MLIEALQTHVWQPHDVSHHLDCDIGFDSDDFWAQLILTRENCLDAVTTTLFKPDIKVLASKSLTEQLKINNLLGNMSAEKADRLLANTFAGAGYYESGDITPDQKEAEMLRLYPLWPTNLIGNPRNEYTRKNGTSSYIYPHQLKAFRETKVLTASDLPTGSQFDQFIAWLEQQDKVVITSTAPVTNIAKALREHPKLVKEKIQAIVMMNGHFTERMGYNGGLNLQDTDKVFKSGIPCFIVPSKLAAEHTLPLNRVAALRLQRNSMTPLGRAMLTHLENWELWLDRQNPEDVDHRTAEIKNCPIFADPLAALVTVHPEMIKEVRRVEYNFHPDAKADNGGDLHVFHPEANKLFEVNDSETSNVFIIESFKDPEQVQDRLEGHIMKLYASP